MLPVKPRASNNNRWLKLKLMSFNKAASPSTVMPTPNLNKTITEAGMPAASFTNNDIAAKQKTDNNKKI